MRIIDLTNLRTGTVSLDGKTITWHNCDTESFDFAIFKYNLEVKEYDH